jgi:signal transduction histidine kinase
LATVREGLTNVARHAQATSARVRLSVADGRCRLEISDDGVGFAEGSSREASDGEFADRINGLGLTILARRAERLGGTLETSINEPRGAALVWDVPVAVPGISATLVNPRLPL